LSRLSFYGQLLEQLNVAIVALLSHPTVFLYIHIYTPETVANNDKKKKYTKTDYLQYISSDITHSGVYG